MSTIFNITPRKVFSTKRLLQKIKNTLPDTQIGKKENNHYQIWIEGTSFKGVDLTFSKPFLRKWNIEIRNTILSHPVEYELTNIIAEIIFAETKGKITNEEDGVISLPLYDLSKSEELFLDDTKSLLILVNAVDDVTLFGVHRKIYFGKRVYELFKPELEKEKELAEKMKLFLYKSQYQVPDYTHGLVIELKRPGDSENKEPILMKLISNAEDILLDKYDYLLLNKDSGNPLMINHDILFKILPDSWYFVDEYTVIAPILPSKEWQEFIKQAEDYDIFDEVMNNLN